MVLYLLRQDYGNPATIGDLIINHTVWCHTLEDVVRPKDAVKVPGQTAIPAGRYEIIVSFSSRFKKELPEVLNVPAFTGIRMHGGNISADTEGCILVAKNIVDKNTVQGSMSDMLVALLNGMPGRHHLEIINSYPYVTPGV